MIPFREVNKSNSFNWLFYSCFFSSPTLQKIKVPKEQLFQVFVMPVWQDNIVFLTNKNSLKRNQWKSSALHYCHFFFLHPKKKKWFFFPFLFSKGIFLFEQLMIQSYSFIKSILIYAAADIAILLDVIDNIGSEICSFE